MKQRGNILFLILLAVVLFAALSYAVTSSMRGGGSNSGKENAELAAADILNYFSQVDTAVQRMVLTGGVEDYQLNFYYQSTNNFVMGSNDNTNCTDSRCRVFDPSGGGVSGRNHFSEYMSTPNTSYAPLLLYASVNGVGSSKPDIVLALRGIKASICSAITKKAGIDYIIPQGVIPTSGDSWMYQFSIPVGSIPDSTEDTPTNITTEIGTKQTFCACHTTVTNGCESAGFPVVYHVVLAR